jgi:hypothetical protein
MIAQTTVQQPAPIRTTVTVRGNSLVVESASAEIAVTQVTKGLRGDPGIFVGDEPPPDPSVNQLWFDTST